MRSWLYIAVLCVTYSLLLVACDDTDSKSASLSLEMENVANNYVTLVQASYTDSITAAENLEIAVDAFLDSPSEDTLAVAQQAWRASREPYGQTEVYRFYDGPIDADDGLLEGLLNAWPLDESYIDYVDGASDSGLINDTSIQITQENLVEQNGADAEDAVTTGYHAIEFLLWGQDLNETEGTAGLRSYTDYVTDGSGTHSNQERRGDYLSITSELLVTHLTEVGSEWDDHSTTNYQYEFLQEEPKEIIRKIMLGVRDLASAELAGSRMEAGLVAMSQEEEHSCFSDNTHRDIAMNFQGILNIYYGHYTNTRGITVGNGSGLHTLIVLVNPELDETLISHLDDARDAIEAIVSLTESGTPFDEQLSDDDARAMIQDAINAINAFATSLEEAATALEIELNAAP